jgi:hypothetical protein
MDCINCGTALESKFCPACGQRSEVKRITFKEAFFDFWSRVYGFDGMFPRTLRDLTIRPAKTAKSFISGNRILYYGPVGYFFLMITVCLLIFSLIGLDFMDYVKGAQSKFITPSPTKLFNVVMQFVSDNLKIFAFLVIPFQAMAARFVFFRKSNYNFLEHSVLPFYTMGHIYWMTILFGIIMKLRGISLAGYSIIFTIIYFGFAYSDFMENESKVKSFLKGVGVYVVAQFFFILTSMIIGVVVIYILSQVAPDVYESIRPSNNR